jgi:hypothetical protein
MPSGNWNPNASDFSKVVGGEVSVDSDLRKIVKIGAITSGATFNIDGTVNVENTVAIEGIVDAGLTTPRGYAVALLSFSAASGSQTVISAPGGGTSIKVLGICICNENADSGRRFEFRFGSTPFVRGYVGPELPFNWNLVAHPAQGATNTAVNVWANGTVIAPVTIAYTKV